MYISSERIKNRRIALGMSQEDLALKCGYKSRSSINKIEIDCRDLPLKKLEVIAEALNVSPMYLMGWEDINGNEETVPEEISTETVYNYLVRCGFIESGEDLTDADLQFLEGQLASIALWFKNKKDSRK